MSPRARARRLCDAAEYAPAAREAVHNLKAAQRGQERLSEVWQPAAAAAPAPAASALPGSRFLHDDFMMGRGRMRDFDHELDEDVEDGGGFGGGLDDVDD